WAGAPTRTTSATRTSSGASAATTTATSARTARPSPRTARPATRSWPRTSRARRSSPTSACSRAASPLPEPPDVYGARDLALKRDRRVGDPDAGGRPALLQDDVRPRHEAEVRELHQHRRVRGRDLEDAGAVARTQVVEGLDGMGHDGGPGRRLRAPAAE